MFRHLPFYHVLGSNSLFFKNLETGVENINDEIKNLLIQSREKINLYVYKPDLSWIEMYINIVEHIITYLLLYILPYSIKNNFTQQKKIVDEEIYEYRESLKTPYSNQQKSGIIKV